MTRWRAASLITVHVLFGLHLLHWKLAGRTLAPVEPSEMFDTLHLGVVTVGFLFMAGLVLATLIAGRFFCGWGCHILALQDLSEWLLRRLKIPTKPIRSRALIWVPPLSVFYLFVWPQIERLLRGEPLPTLHVVTDPDGWTSFTTTDLLRSFPGLGMTLFTFAICGFAIVYFLGSRSFCSYACPYGAIFAAADRLSPLRIVAGTGACSDCGLCTASCRSSVQVIEEVREYGAVMNANCMKDLDCVTVCPTGAIRYAPATPPALRSWSDARGLAKSYDFTRGEDLLITVAFLLTLPVLRGLYDSVALLLALALSAMVAYLSVVALRLTRNDRVVVGGVVLREAGKLNGKGRAVTVALAVLGVFMLHSGFVRIHTYAGQWIAHRAHDQDDLLQAIAHFEQASRWGLLRPRGLRQSLADLHQRTGELGKARDELNALLAIDPDDLQSRLNVAQLWRLEGRDALARRQSEQVLESIGDEHAGDASWSQRRIAASALLLLGDLAARAGDMEQAEERFASAVRRSPRHAEARLAMGAMQASQGRLDEAEESFRTASELTPGSAAAHNNLASVLQRMGRDEEALESYERSLEIAPDNALSQCNAGLLLLRMGRLDEAEEALKKSLRSQPGYGPAQEALEQIEQTRDSSPRASNP